MNRVLVISTSMRANSNSDYLARVFCESAKAEGNEVEYVSLRGKKISFCVGCSACHATHRCVLQDDMGRIIDQMRSADVLVFATPIYFFEMSGQMKTLLDRTNPMFLGEYSFREVYLLTAAHDGREEAIDGCIKGLNGWIECFDRVRLAGVIRGNGLSEYGDAKADADLLEQVRKLAQAI